MEERGNLLTGRVSRVVAFHHGERDCGQFKKRHSGKKKKEKTKREYQRQKSATPDKMCYSEVLIFVQNNESFCIKKSSVLCASLNSKNSFYGVVFFIYAVCYSIFCAVQQLPVGNRISEVKCYIQDLK